VVLPRDFDFSVLNDSKALSERRREEIFEMIINQTDNYTIEHLSSSVIDKMGILEATKLAFRRAVLNLPTGADFVILDGLNINVPDIPQVQIIKADATIATVAAASILAKVSRDRHMYTIDKKYPQYDFKTHKGYGTREHIEAIKRLGPCPIHRFSFNPVSAYKK